MRGRGRRWELDEGETEDEAEEGQLLRPSRMSSSFIKPRRDEVDDAASGS